MTPTPEQFLADMEAEILDRPATAPAYVVVADGEVDQIVETVALADRERRDLEAMGCRVRIKVCASMEAAERYADKPAGRN